ncbi:MAG: HD-GYP domain-containing protein [Oscillospiraceae bacterium]
MELIQSCKLQIACLVFLLYISFLYITEGNSLNKRIGKHLCNRTFDVLFVLGELCVVFDGATAYTVNHLDTVPQFLNSLIHLLFLLLLEAFVCTLFAYWLQSTGSLPKKISKRILCFVPAGVFFILTIAAMPLIRYDIGEYSNYSMGLPVYSCYASVALYVALTIVVFMRKSAYIEKRKKTGFFMTIITCIVIWSLQLFVHESLFAAVAVVLMITSIYLLMENPAVKESQEYHKEMIMGFATLVENKDNSTGGHIKRTSMYAEIIANELRKDMHYHYSITKDFMKNLIMAAPMHDIGKIGIPDVILQKPGKLTDEEFAVMKTHPVIGAQIINDTFGHLMDDDYQKMAYEVAFYHHEKWNGRGYPNGLKENEIPLCARIMAVADVFDAVSAKRCYRDALPLETCFKIIQDGKGKDFDPDIVDAFFRCREQIEKIAATVNGE